MMQLFRKKAAMPTAETALKGRSTAIPTAKTHFVNGRALKGPYPAGTESVALPSAPVTPEVPPATLTGTAAAGLPSARRVVTVRVAIFIGIMVGEFRGPCVIPAVLVGVFEAGAWQLARGHDALEHLLIAGHSVSVEVYLEIPHL